MTITGSDDNREWLFRPFCIIKCNNNMDFLICFIYPLRIIVGAGTLERREVEAEPERDPLLWPLSGAMYNGVLCEQSMLLDIFNMHAYLHVHTCMSPPISLACLYTCTSYLVL